MLLDLLFDLLRLLLRQRMSLLLSLSRTHRYRCYATWRDCRFFSFRNGIHWGATRNADCDACFSEMLLSLLWLLLLLADRFVLVAVECMLACGV